MRDAPDGYSKVLKRDPVAIDTTRKSTLSLKLALVSFALVAIAPMLGQAAEDVNFLSDRDAGIRLRHHQRWGDLGFDTAAAPSRGTGTPLRIGEKTYARGLGHHADGEIVIDLSGQYSRFRARVGVQWQGGKKGSVIFRVVVDGKTEFQTGPMSDSDPARQVDVSLVGARQLRLDADDAGDGIGCDMANWIEAHLVRDPRIPLFGNCAVSFDDEAAPSRTAAAGGFALIARNTGPQVAVMETARTMTVSVQRGEQVSWTIPVKNAVTPIRIMADVRVIGGGQAQVELSLGQQRASGTIRHGEGVVLATEPVRVGAEAEIVVTTRGGDEETGVRWSNLRYALDDQVFPIPMVLPQAAETFPPPALPNPRPTIERELVEWDWRMQDGIGTAREPRTWQQAIETVLERGDRLIEHLASTGTVLGATRGTVGRGTQAALDHVQSRWSSEGRGASEWEWETLWQEVHALRRQIVFANPLADVGPLLFVKRVPSGFSHQLTQYAGRRARGGGGVFVLDAPGRSMQLAGSTRCQQAVICIRTCRGTAGACCLPSAKRAHPVGARAVRGDDCVLSPVRNVRRRFGPAATDRRALRRFFAAVPAQREDPVHLDAPRRISSLRTRAVSRAHDGRGQRRRLGSASDLVSRDA